MPGSGKSYNEKVEFAYAICEQALKPAPLTSRHIAVIDRAVRKMYDDYFSKRNDRRRSKKKRMESPTIRTMRQLIADNAGGNDSAEELAEQAG